jgi:dihydrofolate synthase/folylpolyglutamate synthase
MPAEMLQQIASGYQLRGKVFQHVNEALSSAIKDARHDDLIFVGGSTFVVAEVL